MKKMFLSKKKFQEIYVNAFLILSLNALQISKLRIANINGHTNSMLKTRFYFNDQ